MAGGPQRCGGAFAARIAALDANAGRSARIRFCLRFAEADGPRRAGFGMVMSETGFRSSAAMP
ncbi:hypothetical protein X566_07525 [Afipia sp. P52-10]|jgi:hypothetical protein|nr:hypothetical protein X566_07525 [Afipia sp. P52-10]